MEKKDKVYCSECVYCSTSMYFPESKCMCNPRIEDTPIRVEKIQDDCWLKNADNNCIDFTPTFFRRCIIKIKRILKEKYNEYIKKIKM